MDNVKMPFIPEDVLKIQRVEIYLNDLKNRLNDLRLQHDEVIHSSVEMIKEIDEVSSTLLSTSSNTKAGENMSKIRKLILEFESANEKNNKKTPVTLANHTNVQKILQNFEKLNESHFLKDSLTFLRKARESLEKIDTCLGAGIVDLKKNNITDSIRDKIDLFNPNRQNESKALVKSSSKQDLSAMCSVSLRKSVDQEESQQIAAEQSVILNETIDDNAQDKQDTISNYASCCSSLGSLCFSRNSINGYEGDIDDSDLNLNSKLKRLEKFNNEDF